ncbi:MAG: hypothetical protein WAT22_19260 [Saprospiraceae bacterium]|jgi:hypothetical protein|nr:hypothetical protein [Saprospiraceae bacterium]MBP6446910.1 hypothetical protein [Saprospiraceae bacterium]
MRNKWMIFVLVVLVIAFLNIDLLAQCPMCKLSAESNLRDGGTQGKGLNNGILYMFAMPYLIVGTLGYLWYKNRKNYDKEPDTP